MHCRLLWILDSPPPPPTQPAATSGNHPLSFPLSQSFHALYSRYMGGWGGGWLDPKYKTAKMPVILPCNCSLIAIFSFQSGNYREGDGYAAYFDELMASRQQRIQEGCAIYAKSVSGRETHSHHHVHNF